MRIRLRVNSVGWLRLMSTQCRRSLVDAFAEEAARCARRRMEEAPLLACFNVNEIELEVTRALSSTTSKV